MKDIFRKLSVAVALAMFAAPAFMMASNQPKTLSDKVRHELAMLPYYNVFDELGYQVDGGTVTLTGEVTNPVLKSDAEHVVKHIEGVQTVVDKIEVLPLSPFDNQIRRAEYRAIFSYGPMYRYAMGALPSIHILVKNGHVTLEGAVASQMDKNIAGIRANAVPGVFSVQNNLQVVRG